MHHLVSSRRRDIQNLFSEELEETVKRPRKQLYHNVDEGDDDDEDNYDDIKNFEVTSSYTDRKIPCIDPKSKGATLLAKLGYEGGGLGKSGQGSTEPIPLSTQRGRTGLGHEANMKLGRDLEAKWDTSEEDKTVMETVRWVSATNDVRSQVLEDLNEDWIIVGSRKDRIDDECQYCNGDLIKDMLEAKSIFDHLDVRELQDARSRANPYETIGSAFFQNRAALKMANMDRIFDWLLTKESWEHVETKNPTAVITKNGRKVAALDSRNTDRALPLFYFADICAGPGGFTEYVLWRKKYYNAKGFGMTLKGKDDFKLKRFTAASSVYFEPYYGVHNDGDVTKTANITSFEEIVHRGTNGAGVDLLMADGGFSVENRENIQEILSKRIYLCQFLMALSVLRPSTSASPGGVFVCKLFDILTPFSVGLIYLVYLVFERISLHKPHTSRPANSERYIVCESPSEQYAKKVKAYMTKINDQLESYVNDTANDIREIVPSKIIHSDRDFMDYLVEHNERTTKRQLSYLNKYRIFVKNAGQFDRDQERLREQCLEYWKIPDLSRKRVNDMHEPLSTSISRLVKQVFEFEDIERKPTKFTESVLIGDNEKHIRYAELRMCALTEKKSPILLYSLNSGVYCRSPNSNHGFERLGLNTNLPPDTVLYAQLTNVYDKINEKGKLESVQQAVRILDAAIIDGDDISALPFDKRMAAAEKMCKAIKFNHTSCEKTVPVLTAVVFKLDELGEQMNRFHLMRSVSEDLAVIRESPSQYFYCRGMRVISLFAEPWVMCWSKGTGQPYAFNKLKTKDAIFSDKFEERHCYVNFWRSIVTKKRAEKTMDCVGRPETYHWHWNWAQLGDYGPQQILDDDEHPNGPTWKSIRQIAMEQKCEARHRTMAV